MTARGRCLKQQTVQVLTAEIQSSRMQGRCFQSRDKKTTYSNSLIITRYTREYKPGKNLEQVAAPCTHIPVLVRHVVLVFEK